jgi:hypothetical protein
MAILVPIYSLIHAVLVDLFGEDFEETTNRLERLMTKKDGGIQWSSDHNSRFEVSKSVILHATRKTQRDPEDDNKHVRPD